MASVEESNRALYDDRCGDRVDVTADAADASGLQAAAYDDVHDELLR